LLPALATGPGRKCSNAYFVKFIDVVIILPAAPAAGIIRKEAFTTTTTIQQRSAMT
jgi:hypothetical protein